MADLVQDVRWPGLTAVESCIGTVSHGVSPGTFVLTAPPGSAPAEFGTLILSDGQRAVALRGCKVDRVTASMGPGGPVTEVDILDRRWRWRSPLAAYGAVSGRYNRPDTRGKIVPWSIRSPAELAALCFDALGESGYVIDLPTGLSRSDGADLNRYLLLGENFRQSLANPEQFWDYTPPAEALSRLCDYFGRRVVYQPVRDRFVVATLGNGALLPEGAPYEAKTPSVTGHEPPSHVVVAGAPVRIQARFRLEAVGKDWHGHYVPINDLTYAPRGEAKVQKSEIVYLRPGDPAAAILVRIEWEKPGGTEHAASVQVGPDAIATVWTNLAAAMSDAGFGVVVEWSSAANRFAVHGKEPGQKFTLSISGSVGEEEFNTYYRVEMIQEATPAGPSWETCYAPQFWDVRETDRLSHLEARNLARESVFRCFRITLEDPGNRFGVLKLPWYGEVKRRQQITLQPTKVAQVVPAPRISGGATPGTLPVNESNPNPFAFGILPEFYNGYSRDQEATVTGSVRSVGLHTVLWNPDDQNRFPNTRETDRVFATFTIDPVEQLVVFGDYVFYQGVASSGFMSQKSPRLLLETACLVSDPDTDQFVRWQERLELGGASLPEVMIRDDLAVGVIGKYGDGNILQGHTLLDAADTKARAEYYLLGMAAKYRLTAGDQRQYIGIHAIDLDGAIQQVTWVLGPGGPTTLASRNSEHSPNIPSYPDRRKKENLAPNASAAAANAAERAAIERFDPNAGRRPPAPPNPPSG